MKKKIGLLAAAVAGTALLTSGASADTIILFGGNDIKFLNFESVFDSMGVLKTGADARIPVVGDYLVGIAKVTSITNTTGTEPSFQSPGPGEFTGVFVQKVIGVGAGGEALLGLSDRTMFDGGSFGTFTVPVDIGAGELFRFYQDATSDFTATVPLPSPVTFASTMATAINGSLYLSLGLDDPDGAGEKTAGYYYSTGTVTPTTTATTFGAFNLIVNNTGLSFLPVNDPNEFLMSGGLPGNQGIDAFSLTRTDAYLESKISHFTATRSPWTLQSSDPAFVNAVPTPASAIMSGVLLTLLGGTRSRRRLKK